MISGRWRRQENPHGVGAGAALHGTRIALANPVVADFKGGRDSDRDPSEGSGREENGRGTIEHVNVDLMKESRYCQAMKELEFLQASDAYTHILYLERFLCPSCRRPAPWKEAGLDVR